jgi:hypothetical protein
VRIFNQNLDLLTAAKVVNRHTAYMDSVLTSERSGIGTANS